MEPSSSSSSTTTQTLTLSPFQRNMLFFAAPRTQIITLTSSTRSFLALGLDLPASVVLSLGLRLLYSPHPLFLAPVHVPSIPPRLHKTQLSSVSLPPDKTTYSLADVRELYARECPREFRPSEFMHIVNFWVMAADVRTGLLGAGDVRRFQQGEWQDAVVQRRKDRSDVLPLWRMGPIWTTGHSWAAERFFGVSVYRKELGKGE